MGRWPRASRFIFREREREGDRDEKKQQGVVASRTPLLGTWPATQACALTGNGTSDPLVHRLVLNPLSHTSQGKSDVSFVQFILEYILPFEAIVNGITS